MRPGTRSTNVEQGQPIRLQGERSRRASDLDEPGLRDPSASTSEGTQVFGFHRRSRWRVGRRASSRPGERIEISGAIDNPLTPAATSSLLDHDATREDGGVALQDAPARSTSSSSERRTSSGSSTSTPTVDATRIRGDGAGRSSDYGVRRTRSSQVVRGPSAIGGGWRRFFDLLLLISTTDFKQAFFGTALGYVWSLLRPLLLFGVLLVVFTKIFRVGSDRSSTIRCSCCSTSSSSRSSRRRRCRHDVRRGAGGHRPQDPVPAARDPDVDRAHVLFNLGMNMIAVLVFIARLRRLPDVDLAAVPADPACR